MKSLNQISSPSILHFHNGNKSKHFFKHLPLHCTTLLILLTSTFDGVLLSFPLPKTFIPLHITLASGVQKGQYLTTTWTNLPAVISLRKTCIHFILGFHKPHAICSSEIASLPEISPLNLKSHNSSRFDIIFMFLDTLSDQQFSTSSCHTSFSLNRKHKLFCVC